LSIKAAGGEENHLITDTDGIWKLGKAVCPACGRMILWLINETTTNPDFHGDYPPPPKIQFRLIHPRAMRFYCPPDTPEEIARDFKEACLVLNDSPRASAALSRRCLQNILSEIGGTKSDVLARQIDKVITSGTVPQHITQELDVIRNVGMMAAHPKKNEITGAIMPVDKEEAEWCLNILEQLLTYYLVTLPASRERVSALNEKLRAVGKPPMKIGMSKKPETACTDEIDNTD